MVKKQKVKKQKEPVVEESETPTETDSEVPIRIPFGDVFVGSEDLRLHNEHYVDKLYDSARDVIKGFITGEDVLGNVLLLTTTLMEGVKTYPGLQGVEKKVIVLKVVRKVLSEIPMASNTHAAVISLVNLVLPSAIDLFVAVGKGKFSFKNKCGCI